MKKLTTTLAAIVAILMMVLPLTASAEQIDVTAFQLVDPIVSVNDQPMLDMTGLTVQLAGGSTADGSLTQVFLDVLAGGESANYAVLQFSDDGIVGRLGGMQNAYGISNDALGTAMTEEFGDFDVQEFMTKLENWTFAEDLGALAADFGANDMQYGDPESVEIELAAGKTAMTYIPFTADATQFTYDVFTLIENDALLGTMMKDALAGSGYDSFESMLQDGGLDVQVSGGVATTEDGLSNMVEMKYTVTYDEDPVDFDLYLLDDNSVAESESITLTVGAKPQTGEGSINFTLNGTMTGDDVSIEGGLNSAFGDADSDVDLTYALTYASAAGAGNGTDKLDASYELAGEGSLSLSAYSVEETGETHLEVAVKDSMTDASVYFTFMPAETAAEGAIASGTIELGVSDGTDTYALTSTANLITTTIDTDNFYIDPATAVDLTTMTSEQEDAATTDLGLVMIQTLTKLESGVPGLAGITAGLLGTSAQ